MFKNVLNPNSYHGFNATAPYFEGWYYKLISADHYHKLAIIPGVYIAPQRENSHCFVQVFDYQAEQVRYFRYPFEDFSASRDAFEIQVGPNSFYTDHIKLEIEEEGREIKGLLVFKDLYPWPVKFFSPGAMGWFAWVPFMQTYHGVISMDHNIEGGLTIDGTDRDFSGGKGYIEKDWGKMFPSAYIWGQSNHFTQHGVSIMLSVAVVPYLGFSFGGFVIGLLVDGRFHIFATYNRSKIDEITIDDNKVKIFVHNSSHCLQIRAYRSKGGLLQAPTAHEMDRRITETLNAKIEIQLEDQSGHVIYQGAGMHAGLETVGELQQLLDLVN